MAFDASEFRDIPSVGVRIPIADADKLLSNQISLATKLLFEGVNYHRVARIEDGCLVLEWLPVIS